MKKRAGVLLGVSILAICSAGVADSKLQQNLKTSDTGTDALMFNKYTTTVQVTNLNSMTRQYKLNTNAPLRDNYPSNKELAYSENPGQMIVRTGDLMFDALFALAMEEYRLDSVESITDAAYNHGQPISAPPGGFFQTGKKWTYVWTRDTAYSVDLALAMVDPTRSKNSMEFKLSDRRDVSGNPEIIQDTGSGGSWPISTDRVVWALGAQELLKYLSGKERQEFFDKAYPAIINTVESDRKVIYDNTDGLYTGEQSFLDWREQTYPAWTAQDTVHIGMSKTLSTNVCHYIILRLASEMAAEKKDTPAAQKYAQ